MDSNEKKSDEKARKEKRKVIQQHSSGLLQEDISFAQDVILTSKKDRKADKRRHERTKVIKEATRERRCSLEDQLSFAKGVILQSDGEKKQEKKRNEKIRVIHSSPINSSLGTNIHFAKDVILSNAEREAQRA